MQSSYSKVSYQTYHNLRNTFQFTYIMLIYQTSGEPEDVYLSLPVSCVQFIHLQLMILCSPKRRVFFTCFSLAPFPLTFFQASSIQCAFISGPQCTPFSKLQIFALRFWNFQHIFIIGTLLQFLPHSSTKIWVIILL